METFSSTRNLISKFRAAMAPEEIFPGDVARGNYSGNVET
jgi:hypothetical protein